MYGKDFYEKCLGEDYSNREYWSGFFGKIAQNIVGEFSPKTVLDAGCASGYLVEALRDLGVDAYGIDISEYAIGMSRRDIRPYLNVQSITDGLPEDFPKTYDLVVSIEVLEHMFPEDGMKAIEMLCSYTDTVIFTSTPYDIMNKTHVNVQQREYWAEIFARNSFYRELAQSVSFICEHAMLFRKSDNIPRVIFNYELCGRVDKLCYEAVPQKEKNNGHVYFDCGDGFSEEVKVSFSYTRSNVVVERISVPNGCQRIRLDPLENYFCAIGNVMVGSNEGLLALESANDNFRTDGFYYYFHTDPYFVYSTGNKVLFWIEIRFDILVLANNVELGFIENLGKKIKGVEKKTLELSYVHSNQIEELRKQKEEETQKCMDLLTEKEEEVHALYEEMKEVEKKHEKEKEQWLERREELEGEKGQLEREKRELEKEKGQLEEEKEKYKKEYSKAICACNEITSRADYYHDAFTAISNAQFWKVTFPVRFVLGKVKGIVKATLWKITKLGQAILNVLEHPFKKKTSGGQAAKKTSPALVKRGVSVWKNEGFRVLVYKIRNRKKHKDEYQLWMEQNENNIFYVEPLEYNPLISVVVPVYNVADDMLKACIESVINQTYSNWELCLVDDCSTMDSVRKVLKRYEGREKIKIKYRGENGHISRTTNDGIAMSSGEFIGLMDCDDLLAPNALYEVARLLNKDKNHDFIYSDEDKIDEQGKERRDPFFKPDWSPDTFMSYMYTCHFSVYRKKLIDELGGLRVGYEGSQDYDLVLRVMERTNHIGHIAKILYHWRMRRESTASNITAKPYIIEATVKAKMDALMRRGLKGKLTCIDKITQFRVTYEPQGEPFVSVIIPSKDNDEIIKKCIMSIKNITAYTNYEIIIVDNGSSEENMEKYRGLADQYNCAYFYQKKEFNFSYMCNKGAFLAKGDLLLFLNDDIEIPEGQEEWMTIMVGQAQLGHTGAVGAKLVYPGTNLIQHVGVLNLSIGPGHAFHRFDDSLNFYWGRNLLDYNFSIVTGACLMVARDKFEKVGGFNESFPVAYNDVELCFKLLEYGFYNVLRNDVKLVHHESISRGYDDGAKKAKRLQMEREQLYELHPKFKGYDPCYNPNLTHDKGDFSLNISRVTAKISTLKKFDNSRCIYTEDEINYNIDIFEKTDNIVKISGWAYRKGIVNCNRMGVHVVLADTRGDCYKAATIKTYRPDVNAVHGTKGKLSFSGFECVLDLGMLPVGFYTVEILIGKYSRLIERKILVSSVKDKKI